MEIMHFHGAPPAAAPPAAIAAGGAAMLGGATRSRRPRPHARPTRATGLHHRRIALLFPDNRRQCLRTALSGRFLQSLAETLLPLQLDLIPTLLQEDGELPACIRRGTVDGVIVRGATDVEPLASRLLHLPCVWMLSLGRVPAHGDQVADNPVAAGTIAAEHLLARGHRRLAVLNHDPRHPCYAPRAAAFAATVAEHGRCVEHLADAPMDQLVEAMLALSPRPTAVFLPVPDQEIAQAIQALGEAGIAPMRDLELVCVAHDPARLQQLAPEVPNVEIEAERIAAASVQMLLWRLDNPDEPRRRVMIAPRLAMPEPTR
jgi:LacI family transcriptional regulator